MDQIRPRGESVQNPVFVSLGLLVLDELRSPDKETMYDVAGGSGTYSTLGARLFRPHPKSDEVAFLILAGLDFPAHVRSELEAWGLNLHFKIVPDQRTTRGLLKYEDSAFGRKRFQYIAPPLQPRPVDLMNAGLVRARIVHILAKPDDLISHVTGLRIVRGEQDIKEAPFIVWEPAPPACNKAGLESHLEACQHVDVFSPNHLELTYLIEEKGDQNLPFERQRIEGYARYFLDHGIGEGGKGIAVVRCGEFGCMTLSRESLACWIPPFYSPQSPKVVDATGAGNAFLGGFSVGLQDSGDLKEAAIRGSVAASLALEQIGLPKLLRRSGTETWDDAVVSQRLQDFKSRLDLDCIAEIK